MPAPIVPAPTIPIEPCSKVVKGPGYDDQTVDRDRA
jgi:hypothetical protein